MSDLTIFRNHCRAMATHTRAIAATATEELQTAPGAMRFTLSAAIDTALAENALWERMADEIDNWLTNGFEADPADHTEPLWETT